MKPATAVRVAVLLLGGLPILAACSDAKSQAQTAPIPVVTAAPSPTATPQPSVPAGPDAACQTALATQFNAGAAAADAGETPAQPVDPPACKGVDKDKIKAWNAALAQAWIQQHLTTTTN